MTLLGQALLPNTKHRLSRSTAQAQATCSEWLGLPHHMSSRSHGPSGCMDIVVTYFDTSSSDCRQRVMRKLAGALRSSDSTLTVLTEDFNFVCNDKHRWCKDTSRWTSDRDISDAKNFKDNICKTFQLAEWAQPHPTCETAKARSRIDRVYCNQHLSNQLDRVCSAHALEWCPELSIHRPLSFARCTATSRVMSGKPTSKHTIQHPEWACRVNLLHEELRREEHTHISPMRDLVLKDAIKEVSGRIQGEGHTKSCEDTEDCLGWTMSMIRAAEEVNVSKMEKCVRAYPKIRELVRGADPGIRNNGGLGKLRGHAITLARQEDSEEIQELMEKPSDEGEDHLKAQKKEHILNKLKRLTPGESGALKVRPH